ncbi:MAG: hypothetical protein ABJQ90_16335, partial [Parasphingorhabdus sp.]
MPDMGTPPHPVDNTNMTPLCAQHVNGAAVFQVVEEGSRVLYALFLWQMRPLFERLRQAGSAPPSAGELAHFYFYFFFLP